MHRQNAMKGRSTGEILSHNILIFLLLLGDFSNQYSLSQNTNFDYIVVKNNNIETLNKTTLLWVFFFLSKDARENI